MSRGSEIDDHTGTHLPAMRKAISRRSKGMVLLRVQTDQAERGGGKAAQERPRTPSGELGSLYRMMWERIYCKVRQTAILPGLCSGGGARGRQRSIETMEQGEWVLRKATAFPKKRGENLRNMRKTCTSWNAVYHMFRGMRQAAPSSLGAKCPYPQREAQIRTDNISVGQASKGKGERVTLAIGFMLGALGQM